MHLTLLLQNIRNLIFNLRLLCSREKLFCFSPKPNLTAFFAYLIKHLFLVTLQVLRVLLLLDVSLNLGHHFILLASSLNLFNLVDLGSLLPTLLIDPLNACHGSWVESPHGEFKDHICNVISQSFLYSCLLFH
jgi:hypothetical protein